MSDDSELERLKAKRLEEMQRNISSQQSPEPESEPGESKPKQVNYRDVLLKNLGYRGEEVLKNAESQFPNQAPIVVHKLGELLASGEINEQIDGGKLLALFRSIGVNVRMDTKINVEKDGKFVSLSDKLGVEKSDDA